MRRIAPQLCRLLQQPTLQACHCAAPLATGGAAAAARAAFHSSPRVAAGAVEEAGAEAWVGELGDAPAASRNLALEEVMAMTRKQQQFHLTQLLRGNASLREADSDEQQERSLEMQVIDVNRTVKVTKGGSLQRFSALVVVGNGNGVVGWAMGKAPEVGVAIDKAYSRAARSLFFFERFEGHTIFHETGAKYGKTSVKLAPLPSGSGLKANTTVAAVCRLAGIKDVRAKVLGSHNPNTTLRAVFEALDAVRSPSEVGEARGRTVICLSPTAAK